MTKLKIEKITEEEIITKDDFIIFANDLMYVMTNTELLKYKQELDAYKEFLLRYIKQWNKEVHYVKQELKERLEDLEIAEIIAEDERLYNSDWWELDGRMGIH